MSKREFGDGEPSPDDIDRLAKEYAESHLVGDWERRLVGSLLADFAKSIRSGAAQEVSPPSPEPLCSPIPPRGALQPLRDAIYLIHSEANRWERAGDIKTSSHWRDVAAILSGNLLAETVRLESQAEGDTRELKAALRKALLIHWLSQIECNHEEKNDSAICACGWKSERGFNVGKAVELWIDHVFAELG